MEMEFELAWPNYVTGEYDYISAPADDETAKKYIPQDPSVQAIYEISREMGKNVPESMRVALEAFLGVKND